MITLISTTSGIVKRKHTVNYPYLNTASAQKEKKLCEKFGLYSDCMIDPEKSFDNLKNGPDSMEKNCFFMRLFWQHWATRKRDGSHLVIDIDFSKINSLENLKVELNALLDLEYKDIYKKYTASFDTLISFVDTGSFAIVKAIGDIPEEWLDEMGFEKAREKALKEGVISREATKVPVLDSLFGTSYTIDSLRYVPFTTGVSFNMDANEILTSSNLTVQVVEVSTMYDDLLNGMDRQLIVNYKDERMKIVGFEGVKFGSLEEGTLTGNWE